MRDDNLHLHHQQQQLWLSVASLKRFVIFKALVLLLISGQQLALADLGPTNPTCYDQQLLAPSSPCAQIFKNYTLFPFLTSRSCAPGSASSSFIISGCASGENPRWPNFVHATNIAANSTFSAHPLVRGFHNTFDLSPSSTNSANASSDTYIYGSSPPLNPPDPDSSFGLINLTWNLNLTNNQISCGSPASLNQIVRDYLPQSINLTSFAHSSFQFSPSNIILLFNCTSSSSSVSHHLQNNSDACKQFMKDCNLGDNSNSCFQYTPAESKELNLPQAMKSSQCKSAMFFVSTWSNYSLNASKWVPGLIQLNWSNIDNPWMAANIKSCEGCLQTNGSCGYKEVENFQCYCANSDVLGTNCTGKEDHGTRCTFLSCIAKKIGFVAAGFAVALSLSFTIFCIWKRKVFMKTSVPYSSPQISKSWMKKPSFLWRKQDPILAKEMSYQEIVQATESFAETHMLGDGGFGAVYKGVLADGRKVAVKRLYHDNYRRMEHFFNEIKVLSKINHPNLVKLYGFCYEDDKDLLLIFEYAPQGTVSDQLHNASKPPMSWKLRLDIACETAEALSYLHNSVSPPIYHRDVKTTNILLDEGFHAKLADFGLSKLVPLKATHVSTAPQGTPGYLDPDYHQCYQLTDKSDVYSLGVVLMELISAKLAVDMSRERGEINLSTLAVMKIQCGQLEELVDPALKMKNNPCVARSINRVVELAFQCLHAERDERPSMSVVAETLAKIRRENADDDAEALPNEHVNTHRTPTTCQLSCVSNGRNGGSTNGPKKPFQHSQDSPCSVFFSSGSSNPSSNLSST